MISHLRGALLEKNPNMAVVDVHGVGYEVTIPVSAYTSLPAVGAEVALHIHTHVREDALSLFGFISAADKALFEKLISVSGIGPKLAVTALSGLASGDLIAAIRTGAVDQLVKIPGVGKKTAERMVLELRDKLDSIGVPAQSGGSCGIAEQLQLDGRRHDFGADELRVDARGGGGCGDEGEVGRGRERFRRVVPAGFEGRSLVN